MLETHISRKRIVQALLVVLLVMLKNPLLGSFPPSLVIIIMSHSVLQLAHSQARIKRPIHPYSAIEKQFVLNPFSQTSHEEFCYHPLCGRLPLASFQIKFLYCSFNLTPTGLASLVILAMITRLTAIGTCTV